MFKKIRPAFAFLFTIIVLQFSGVEPAEAVKVKPVVIHMLSGQKEKTIEITNDHRETMRFRIDTRKWTQDSLGKDIYEPTGGFLAYPPVFELAPGQSRSIRLIWREADARPPANFRVILRDITQRSDQQQAGMRLGTIHPVHIYNYDAKAIPAARNLGVQNDGMRHILLTNSGGRHAVVKRVTDQQGNNIQFKGSRTVLQNGATLLKLPGNAYPSRIYYGKSKSIPIN